ncbi:MAG: phosphoserine phosphatase SerB [Clostridia bacterium]
MNLVLQGSTLTEQAVREIGSLPLERLSSSAFRIRNAPRTNLDSWSEKHRADYAFVPDGRRFADLKLLAMDMDSTLITIECIDEIGDFAGKKAEIAAITAEAMRGEIDYKQSLRKRVSLLKGLDEKALSDVYENRLRLTPGAATLIAACKRHGVKLLLVSGGFTFFTDRLKARLGIDYTISNTLEIENGKLTGGLVGDIVDADAKARKFLQVVSELKIKKEETLAIGDGANDLKMMKESGLSIAFHAKPVVRAQADVAITYGGLDAVLNLFE